MRAVGVWVRDVENRDKWRFRTSGSNSWVKGEEEERTLIIVTSILKY